jgi:conjugal transfer pilus assembly protein TraW
MKNLSSKLFLTTLMIMMICSVDLSYAKDLGVVGQTYTILEDDFLNLVETRYQTMKVNGEWDKTQKAWQKQIVRYADRPKPVDTVTKSHTHRVYYFDPSIELSHDIIGLNGETIAKAGTVINPLEIMPLHETLLFINADDSKQLSWAIKKDKELEGKTKWILVNGSITDTIQKIKKQVYFDQEGRLTSHFKMEHVPATLQQDGLSLKIEEYVP